MRLQANQELLALTDYIVVIVPRDLDELWGSQESTCKAVLRIEQGCIGQGYSEQGCVIGPTARNANGPYLIVSEAFFDRTSATERRAKMCCVQMSFAIR